MSSTERLIERAEQAVEREAAASLARVRAELMRPGRIVCDCGEEISEARRRAHPSARDCIDCAMLRERKRRA